eukprot:scaffold23625_cov137-Cylindrotheca_fusiformis.AAC.20
MAKNVLMHIAVMLIVSCFDSSTHGLQSSSRPSNTSKGPFKSTPATVAIQDGNTVRELLESRTTRGKVKTSPSKLPKRRETRAGNKGEKKPLFSRSNSGRVETAISIGKVAKGINIPYALTIEALRNYHQEHDHLVLPRRFVVPEKDDYPKELHGIDLAGTVYDMKWWQRHVKERPDRVTELNRLGFVWERLQSEWNLVLEGLMAYGTNNGNLLVPSKFVVPFESNWPKATWGLALGNCVYRIRSRGDFLHGPNAWKRRDQLDAIGFIWCTSEYKFNKFCKALRLYAEIEATDNGYCSLSALKVPSQFVVPSDNNAWPKHLWGYKLGQKCTAVRQKQLYIKGHPERLKILANVGFHLGGNDSLSWLKVVHASAVYSQMHGKKLDVKASFVVPAPPKRVPNNNGYQYQSVMGSDEAWPWPEYLWGFPLGQRLKDIRLKGYYLNGKDANARRSQLDALGFVWEPKRGRRKMLID